MVRKKIFSKNSNSSLDDDVDIALTDDLEPVSSVGSNEYLQSNGIAFHMQQQMQKFRNNNVSSDSQDIQSSSELACECDICMKSFFRKQNDVSWACPYCGHKMQKDDLEELNEMQDNSYKNLNVSECRAIDRRAKFQHLLQSRSDNWQDGRKEQLSLEMGSDEYSEYVDDLSFNCPDKDSDSFHVRLEQYNEDLVTKGYDSPYENEESAKLDKDIGETPVEIQKREEMQKRDLHVHAVREAIAASELTESLSDDALARAITSDNIILYNKSVKPDEYIEALKEYVVEPSM